MKKLILFLFVTEISFAQELNFGINASMKFSHFKRIGIGEFEQYRNEEKQISIYSFNLDWEYAINKNFALHTEIGYTFSTQNDFEGPEFGIYYSTNKLIDFLKLKAGLLYVWNLPFNTPHNSVSARAVSIASLSIIKQIYETISIEVFYQIPLKSKYVEEQFVTSEFTQNLLGFGLEFDL